MRPGVRHMGANPIISTIGCDADRLIRTGFFGVLAPITDICVWRSLVARLLWEQKAAGSNPAARTTGEALNLLRPEVVVTRSASFFLRI